MNNGKKKKALFTRQSECCPLLGSPKTLSGSNLPTVEDMLLCLLEVRSELKMASDSKKEPPFSNIADSVATQIERIYHKASIPIVSRLRVIGLISRYYRVYCKFKKTYNRDNKKDNFKKKVRGFIDEAKTKLFDIAACKCPMMCSCVCNKNPSTCDCPVTVECKCEKERKIPLIERKFMYDQRTDRVRFIGTLDKKETNKLLKRNERKEKILTKKVLPSSVCGESSSITMKRKSPHRVNESDEVPIFSTSQMRLNLTSTVIMSDRFGVSDRATGAIASCVLKDLGVISKKDTSLVIDKNKVRREKKKARKAAVEELRQLTVTKKGIYFDGRKDSTIYQEKIGFKMYRRIKKEEHITIVLEPGGIYFGHITPGSGTAIEIAKCILSHLQNDNFDIDGLVAIGCDGTPINTGWKNGVIHNIEVLIHRPLQWFICLLHFNELPFRHFFKYLDGETEGPSTFNGEIGKELPGCEKLPVVKFEAVKSEEIHVSKSDLSKDQKYLLDMVKAIRTGECSTDLAVKDPGPLRHSRWLTCANRVLRLYVSKSKPTKNLKMLVNYILNTYAPVWFNIKMNHSVKYGPKHVFDVIKTTRYLPKKIKAIIDPVIQRNAYFCHPENMLLAMIADERKEIRELGYKRILEAKNKKKGSKEVRTFIPPAINFDATDYVDVIQWNNCILSPPPILENLTTEDISFNMNRIDVPQFDYLNYPCHTQAVERCVKLVTESANKVCGKDNREGYIHATLLSRSSMPSFDCKANFHFKAD